ncbi:MAG: tetratricopeptide repeat protein [Treponema sp.]|jgi:tetratricopeptide (TPR) repeat protein|nr:tetratricopeptide repeat protein [Treponema sp.]
MKKTRDKSEISAGALKNQVFHALMLFLILAALATVFIFLFKSRIYEEREKKSLLEHWETGLWEKAYEKSRECLAQKPMDLFFLTINGFSAYQLALAQVNNEESLVYIDECIWSLRKALLGKNADKEGRIRYVLGKAYYVKGPDYTDLAVKYLEEAKTVSFNAGDINEYLGLSYAAIKDYQKSVEAFTASLVPSGNEGSDLLLLYIAQSYAGLEEWETARAYLVRCAEVSMDVELTLKAQLLLGKVLVCAGDSDSAIQAFESVLEIVGENAEASYELGEIYASRGETTRARAAWRRAYRADPNFTPVLARLNTL